MKVLSELLVIITVFVISTEAHAELVEQTFVRLRALPESMLIAEFSKLDSDTKKELFFIANGRHPPYSGFDSSISQQGVPFLLELRDELEKKGGTPEVLDFLSIANQMKLRGVLTTQDIKTLKLNDFCLHAPRSNYCPVLLSRILGP